MLLIFICWFLSYTFTEFIIRFNSFFVEFFRFFLYLRSCHLWIRLMWLLPFQFECPLLFFSCLITLTRTSSTILNISRGSVSSQILEERLSTFNFSPFSTMLPVGLSYIVRSFFFIQPNFVFQLKNWVNLHSYADPCEAKDIKPLNSAEPSFMVFWQPCLKGWCLRSLSFFFFWSKEAVITSPEIVSYRARILLVLDKTYIHYPSFLLDL